MQRARLAYALDLGKMWTVHSCSWATEGSGLKTDRLDFDPAALVGEPFDVRALENIRSNVASSFRNSGFPSVQASHVAFVADTLGMSKDKKVAVTVELLPVDYTAVGAPIPHEVTRFGRIDWSCKERENGKVPCIADNVVDFLLAVDSGMLFNERVLQDTYRRLSNVPGVSRVEMPGNLRSQGLGEEVLYDVGVNLELNQRIDLTAEAQMIRSDARYGPIGSIGFRNNNVRGKADVLEFALTGGIISTRPFSYTGDALVPNSGTWSIAGTYSTLGIPPLSLGRLRPSNEARTEFTLNWGREVRPEYAREAATISYGFRYVENPERESKLRVTPVEFRYANITADVQFAEWLAQQANPVLEGRFCGLHILGLQGWLELQMESWSRTWSLALRCRNGRGWDCTRLQLRWVCVKAKATPTCSPASRSRITCAVTANGRTVGCGVDGVRCTDASRRELPRSVPIWMCCRLIGRFLPAVQTECGDGRSATWVPGLPSRKC